MFSQGVSLDLYKCSVKVPPWPISLEASSQGTALALKSAALSSDELSLGAPPLLLTPMTGTTMTCVQRQAHVLLSMPRQAHALLSSQVPQELIEVHAGHVTAGAPDFGFRTAGPTWCEAALPAPMSGAPPPSPAGVQSPDAAAPR